MCNSNDCTNQLHTAACSVDDHTSIASQYHDSIDLRLVQSLICL